MQYSVGSASTLLADKALQVQVVGTEIQARPILQAHQNYTKSYLAFTPNINLKMRDTMIQIEPYKQPQEAVD